MIGGLFSSMCRDAAAGFVLMFVIVVAIMALAISLFVDRYGVSPVIILAAPACVGMTLKYGWLVPRVEKKWFKARDALLWAKMCVPSLPAYLIVDGHIPLQRVDDAEKAKETAWKKLLSVVDFPVMLPGLAIGLACAATYLAP